MKTLFFILATCLVASCSAQGRPPSYSLDDMPETSFDCRDKILGGYYADPETDCQMFHVCVKVPGVGVQNYRFLCPNDTAFDQESQICASWYDVDCEAALLYSDNFDLYRIGHVPSSPALVAASKATALPLGPSTAAPLLSRGRQPYNSRQQSQADDDYYLQAGDVGDRHLQPKDVLRGSSSGNFFNQKKGRDEEEESVIGKKKVAVRKFRKRPQQLPEDNGSAASTPAPAPSTYLSTAAAGSRSTSGNTYLPRYSTAQRGSQTPAPEEPTTQQRRAGFVQRASTTTAAPEYQTQSRGSYNYQQQTNYNFQSSTLAPAVDNYKYQAETRSNYNAPSPTASTSLSNNYKYQTLQRNNNNSPSTTVAPSRGNTNYNDENVQTNTDYAGSTTFPPSAAVTNYQQRIGNVQRYDTFAPVTTFSPRAYSTGSPLPSNGFDAYGNTLPQKFKSNNDFSGTTAGSTPAVTSAPFVAENYQRNNNVNQRANANTFSTTTAKPAYTYYDDYQTKSTGSSEEYNNYNPNTYDYQRTNYNTGSSDSASGSNTADVESLKTAPSNNYGPNSYNSFPNDYSGKSGTDGSKSNDVSQNNYNTGFVNGASYDTRESSYYSGKLDSFNTANTSAQQTTRNNVYSGGITNQPATSQRVSSFTIRQVARTTDAGSASYETNNDYKSGYYSSTPGPRYSYNTNQPASAAVTSNGRRSDFTQTTAVNAVTTQRPQFTQPASRKQNPLSVGSQASTFRGDKQAAAASTTVSPANGQPTKADAAYDYAYYDETAPSEYDGTDPISDRHFSKESESLKVARSTK